MFGLIDYGKINVFTNCNGTGDIDMKDIAYDEFLKRYMIPYLESEGSKTMKNKERIKELEERIEKELDDMYDRIEAIETATKKAFNKSDHIGEPDKMVDVNKLKIELADMFIEAKNNSSYGTGTCSITLYLQHRHKLNNILAKINEIREIETINVKNK